MKSFQSNWIFATIVAVFAFYNRSEQEKQNKILQMSLKRKNKPDNYSIKEKKAQTRPSKQCKSLIWILVFVFPVVICHRKRRVRQFWQIFNYSGNFSSYRQCIITNALQRRTRDVHCCRKVSWQRLSWFFGLTKPTKILLLSWDDSEDDLFEWIYYRTRVRSLAMLITNWLIGAWGLEEVEGLEGLEWL